MQKFIQRNSWGILIFGVGFVAAWAILNYRVALIEAKVAQYPSAEWFDLKFSVLERDIGELRADFNSSWEWVEVVE